MLSKLSSVRCERCGKLLFTIGSIKDDVYIECKCERCKLLNKIPLYVIGGTSE